MPSCVSLLSGGWAERKVLESFQGFGKGRKMRKNPLFLTYPILLKKLGGKRVEVFLCFPFLACFAPVVVHAQ